MKNKQELSGAMRDLIQFHETYSAYIGKKPEFPPPDRMALRYELIREELAEFLESNNDRDYVGACDALIDLLYVVYGACVEYGFNPKPLFEEVHASNMSKLGEDGKPILRGDGKIQKGPNYFKPKLLELLIKQGYNEKA